VANAESIRGPNYQATAITLAISTKTATQIRPLVVENRLYDIERMATAEGALDTALFRTLYATVGEGDSSRGWQIEVYYHPFVSWIWAGAFLMAIGGFVSLADKRMTNASSLRANLSKAAANTP